MFFFVWGSLHCFCHTWTCYECSTCLYCEDTNFVLCFVYFLYEPNFHWSKKWYEFFTTCIMYVYSVCKPDISETSKSDPVYALFATISSEHTQQEFERNFLHLCTAVSCSLLSHCSLGIHSLFVLFLLALYLPWDYYLISEMTIIHVNNTANKSICQPQSVHSLGMLIAENITLPQLRDFRLRTCCKWGLPSFGSFYAASFGNFLPMIPDKSWWWWNSRSSVGEDLSHLGHFTPSTSRFTLVFRSNSPRWRHYFWPKHPLPFTSW
jgi:hypothetical protein